MDSKNFFSGIADIYEQGRPEYSSELVDDLYTKYGFSQSSVIADIGTGTGKFAGQLLKMGSAVIGIEPNDDMRHKAQIILGNCGKFTLVDGDANDTTLQDESVDFITSAQAFHWFDPRGFRKECRRIMKPDGLVVLLWNIRDMNSFVNKECFEIYTKYCDRFVGFHGGLQRDDIRIREFFDNKYERIEYDNPLFFTKEDFIKRCLSGSYSLKETDANYGTYLSLFDKIYEKYSENGILTMGNKSVAYIGKVKR